MNEVTAILKEHGLDPETVYLLELIPLIDMIWADGSNQAQEVALLRRFARDHRARLCRAAAGLEVVTAAQVDAFIDRFTAERPPRRLLADLQALSLSRLRGRREAAEIVVAACMDIAAACVESYPYPLGERLMAEEKRRLRELILALESVTGDAQTL